MKEIKILHLYSRLLSLYGEYGNADYLAKVEEEMEEVEETEIVEE